jgi:alkylation response protein AidB-like acyl-CoA dehydrogenase
MKGADVIIDLQPTEKQSLIVESIDALLRRALPVERLRDSRNACAQAERRVWSDLVELGVFGFGLSADDGGHGYGLPEEALALRSMGRYCLSSTVLATMLAVHIAAHSRREDLREAFQSGQLRAALANPVDERGTVQLLDASGCEWFVVLNGPVTLIPRDSATEVAELRCLDDTVGLERARLDLTQGLVAEVEGRASLLLAAYLVGNAQATLAMAVAHAATREQFGQPIGAFQAIKHSCADMAVRAAAAEAQTLLTAVAAESDKTSLETIRVTKEVASARLISGQAAVANAKVNIQIHGAMGFTAECDAHIFLKRALTMRMLGIDACTERARILLI